MQQTKQALSFYNLAISWKIMLPYAMHGIGCRVHAVCEFN